MPSPVARANFKIDSVNDCAGEKVAECAQQSWEIRKQAAERMRTFFSGKSRLQGQRQLSASQRSKHLMGPLKRNGHLEGGRA